jgi:sphinganine-1-phosphate aldolase
LQRAHNLFFAENALNPMAFKSLKRMEAEVVQMTASMLHAPDDACGTMTTGGTESLLMAVKAARDRAKARGPKTDRPNVVAAITAHPALDKAGHYFGLEIRKAPVGPDKRVIVSAMKKLIDKNTVLLFASAPQYPHGVIDPIDEVGRLALSRGIPLHVDACIGGFVLPWVERLGYPIPAFDFRVPGVTSMSADLHKYGFAVKGASVVVYRDMSYLEHQFFLETEFPGGIYASPSMTGTRGGGPIAAAWPSVNRGSSSTRGSPWRPRRSSKKAFARSPSSPSSARPTRRSWRGAPRTVPWTCMRWPIASKTLDGAPIASSIPRRFITPSRATTCP